MYIAIWGIQEVILYVHSYLGLYCMYIVIWGIQGVILYVHSYMGYTRGYTVCAYLWGRQVLYCNSYS